MSIYLFHAIIIALVPMQKKMVLQSVPFNCWYMMGFFIRLADWRATPRSHNLPILLLLLKCGRMHLIDPTICSPMQKDACIAQVLLIQCLLSSYQTTSGCIGERTVILNLHPHTLADRPLFLSVLVPQCRSCDGSLSNVTAIKKTAHF